MGGGSWDVGTYRSHVTSSVAKTGSSFGYSAVTKTKPSSSWVVADSLDPKKLNTFDRNVRECLSTAEHPDATPIAVIFDVTGSMGGIPKILQEKLPQLFGLLLRKGYVADPQLLFGAVGDANSDRVPLQIGQFESNNESDKQLADIFLEGGGGGGNHESYELALYYLARHAELDCNKDGRLGYLFIIGDERVYGKVSRGQVSRYIGDSLQEDIPTADIVAEAQAKFNVFYLFASQAMYHPAEVLNGTDGSGACYWRNLLGENAIILEDAAAVCETIGLAIGLLEGTAADLDAGMADLGDAGMDAAAIAAAGKALVSVAGGSGTVATVDGDLPSTTGGSGTTRL
jgi:hypothetical protein